jgi:glyoxylase-like metal-dependent hydrolase (beta-lactamase superfamily II)
MTLKRRLAAGKLESIADGVWLLRGGLMRSMNVYLLQNGDGVVVFDAGEKGMADAIVEAAKPLGPIKRVVLGHADTDHRGAAPALAAMGIPVQCHPDAVAEAQGSGGRSYWHMEDLPWGVRKLHGVLHEHVWDGGPVQISGTVAEGDDVAGFEVVELAGHAPGLIGLWRASDRLALVTDCFYVTTMWGRPADPHVPVDAYNLDTERARASLRKLAALEPLIACPGHRGPLTGADVRTQLEAGASG